MMLSSILLAALGYLNPIVPGFHPDPSVCRVDSDYYLVNSSFQFFPGVPIFHSRDLVNWQQIGNVLDRRSQIKLKGANSWGGIYAPVLRQHDGTFYMVTTNCSDRGNFLVTAPSPLGPWSDPVWISQGGIDPDLYWEDGHCYFTSNPNDGIHICEIDPVTGQQLSESRLLWRGMGGRYPEAGHLFKKDGWYYLMIAEGGTEMGHSITIARSRNLYGPYVGNPDNPILCHQRQAAQSNPIQGTGHGDLFQAHDGSWWMVFLAFRPQINGMHILGRETFLAPVKWVNGWPVVNDGNPVTLEMPDAPFADNSLKARSSMSNVRSSFRDDFRDRSLAPRWVYLQNPDSSRYELTGNALRLKGGASLSQNSVSPTFVAHRQQDIECEITTFLTLKGNEGEAGLSVYMESGAHYDLCLTPEDKDGATVRVRAQLDGFSHDFPSVRIPSRKCLLRVVCKADRYIFQYAKPLTTDWRDLASVSTRYLTTETAGGFTGIVIGMYAVGNTTADFDFYSYNK